MQPQIINAAPIKESIPKDSCATVAAKAAPNIGSVEKMSVVSAAESVLSASVYIYTVNAVVTMPVQNNIPNI